MCCTPDLFGLVDMKESAHLWARNRFASSLGNAGDNGID
jgi:hypothetical protein